MMDQLIRQAQKFNIELTKEQIQQFQIYYEMLVETNKVMNLTAITELEEVITKHFIDSLALVEVYPHLYIILMDSLNKRVKFLQSVIDKLELCDINAVHGRAEEAARNAAYRENFDLCVSRAVANLSTLSEYCLPFVKSSGKFISYKSADIEDELNSAKKAIHILGGKAATVKKLTLPDSDIERSFVLIDKIKNTPKAYPRKAGTAQKEPIH